MSLPTAPFSLRAVWRALSTVTLVALFAGCSTVSGPNAASGTGDQQAQPLATQLQPSVAYDVWDKVLQRHVDAEGRIDFQGVADNRQNLDTFVSWIYATGPNNAPQLFPDKDAELAYWLNAYNALAMYSVIDYGLPERFGRLGKIRFFYLRKMQLGGERMSLYKLENEIVRPYGDARIHFALNCMVVSCPRLPQKAFRPATLNTELNSAAREFFNAGKHVELSVDEKIVRVSAILDFYTKDFTDEAGSLISYVNRYRSDRIPVDYTVKFLDYNWDINYQPDRAR